ncbi:Ankyrin repeat and KH domain-containing mask-like protein [Cladobotryum mycophilum]|uniref:Ankyrin repeat and KH domain-containing mask-like protein n=1 Tax=Cladobotryum mycophilum TaxID=491253 RepID=A0ABR0T115_9HYPO
MSSTTQPNESCKTTAAESHPFTHKNPQPQDQRDKSDLPTLEDLGAVVKRSLEFKKHAWSTVRFLPFPSLDEICPWHFRKYWSPYDGKKDAENLYEQFLELRKVLETFIELHDASGKASKALLSDVSEKSPISKEMRLQLREYIATGKIFQSMELLSKSTDFTYAFPISLMAGQMELAKLCLENGAQVCTGAWDTPLASIIGNKATASLMQAALWLNDAHMLGNLIEEGGDIHETANLGHSILIEAVRANSYNSVVLLLAHGASVKYEVSATVVTQNILLEALEAGNSRLFRLLIDHGFELTEDEIYGIDLGAHHLNLALVTTTRPIHETRNPLGIRKSDNPTAAERILLHAVKQGDLLQCIRILGKKALGTDKDVREIDVNWMQDDTTALIEAVRLGHRQIVRLLIQHGADVNIVTWNKKTALRMAAETGCESIIRFLLFHGADLAVTVLMLRLVDYEPRLSDRIDRLNKRWAFALEQNPHRAWHIAVNALHKLQIGAPPKDLNEVLLLVIFFKSIQGVIDTSNAINWVFLGGLGRPCWQLLFDSHGDGELMFRNAFMDIFNLDYQSSSQLSRTEEMSWTRQYALHIVIGAENLFYLREFAVWAQAFGNIMFECSSQSLVSDSEVESDDMRTFSAADPSLPAFGTDLSSQRLYSGSPSTFLVSEMLLDDDFEFAAPDVTDSQNTLVTAWPLPDQGSFNEGISQLSVPASPQPGNPIPADDAPLKSMVKKTFCDDCQQEFKTTSNYGKHRRGPRHQNVRHECKFGCGKDYLRNDTKMRHELKCKKRLGSPKMPHVTRKRR